MNKVTKSDLNHPVIKQFEVELGKVAASEALAEFREALVEKGATNDFLAENLMKLAKFKGEKPFNSKDGIIYTDPLDDPKVQLAATKEIIALKGVQTPSKAIIQEIGPRLAKALADRTKRQEIIVNKSPDNSNESET